jgi:hypothetical protein
MIQFAEMISLVRSLRSSLVILLAVFMLAGLAGAPLVSAQDSQSVGVTQEILDEVDPLKVGGGNKLFEGTTAIETPSSVFATRPTVAMIINRVWLFAFPIAGFILFVMLVWGGFEMVSGAASSKSKDQGRQRATAAIIGFVLLFSVFWIAQIIEYVFKVRIVGG